MKIYITGGTGFLGSYLVQMLSEDERVNKLFVLYRSEDKRKILENHINKKEKINWINGDFFNSHIEETDCDVLIHSGTMRNIQLCENNKEEAYRINVEGTKKLIKDAKSSHVKKVIFLSSQSIYSLKENVIYKEDDELIPNNYYGETKKLSEEIIKETKDIKYIILRPSRLIGPGIFENKDNFISYIMPRKILEERKITLFGEIDKEYNLIDVRECAEIILKLIFKNKTWNETYNIAGNNIISIREINNIYKKLFKDIEYETILKDIDKKKSKMAISNEKITNAIDWEQKYSIEDSLSDIVEKIKK